jgi:hypothetical protein
VRKPSYADDPICFGIGWDTYDPDTKNYNLDIRMDYSQTVATGTNQVKNQLKRYDVKWLELLDSSGFLQLMSSATSSIIEKRSSLTPEEYRFSLLYTYMDTGDFTDNTAQGAMVGIWFPLCFLSLA